MICEQGDIVEVSFDPTRGHEPQKTRPALVVSTNAFNLRSSLTAVCPITSTDNGYPLHVRIDDDEIHGFACVEALRTLDLQERACRKVGVADGDAMGEVLSYIGAIFGI